MSSISRNVAPRSQALYLYIIYSFLFLLFVDKYTCLFVLYIYICFLLVYQYIISVVFQIRSDFCLIFALVYQILLVQINPCMLISICFVTTYLYL